MKTLGLKDMHPMQIRALMDFVEMSIEIAAVTGNKDAVRDVEAAADDLIRLFGGNGVKVEIETT